MPPHGRHRSDPDSTTAPVPDQDPDAAPPPFAAPHSPAASEHVAARTTLSSDVAAGGGRGERDDDAGYPPVTVTPPETNLERLRRVLIGEAALALDATRRARVLGWLLPLGVMVIGGFLRFWRLGVPHKLVFDETYYVKQGFSIFQKGYEASWGENPNPRFEAGDVSMLGTAPEYVVHPPVGKWLIGLGIEVGGGVTSSFAWRLAAAICGTLAILMVARIGRRILASTALGTIAGAFLALDGEALVQSRTSLLDPFLMFFVLAAFGALILDRFQARRRLAERAAAILDAGGDLTWAPGLGMRWWRVVAAVCLGLACGTKWSGIYFLAVFGVMTVWWDLAARRAAGVQKWFASGLLRDGLPAFLILVPGTLAVYLASWSGWFASSDGWGRRWAAEHPGEGVLWLPEPLRALWKYHGDMWRFHNSLESEHTYAAHPLGWIVQWRPTSFFYPTEVSTPSGDAARAICGATSCSQPITSLGNPVLWWAGAAALLVAVWWLVRYRDWRAAAVISGTLAGWLPWFGYAHRTIFTFYSVAFVPWVVLTLVYVLGLLIGHRGDGPDRSRRRALWGVGAFVALVVVVGLFFYPVWTGWVMPYQQWHLRMWIQPWV